MLYHKSFPHTKLEIGHERQHQEHQIRHRRSTSHIEELKRGLPDIEAKRKRCIRRTAARKHIRLLEDLEDQADNARSEAAHADWEEQQRLLKEHKEKQNK